MKSKWRRGTKKNDKRRSNSTEMNSTSTNNGSATNSKPWKLKGSVNSNSSQWDPNSQLRWVNLHHQEIQEAKCNKRIPRLVSKQLKTFIIGTGICTNSSLLLLQHHRINHPQSTSLRREAMFHLIQVKTDTEDLQSYRNRGFWSKTMVISLLHIQSSYRRQTPDYNKKLRKPIISRWANSSRTKLTNRLRSTTVQQLARKDLSTTWKTHRKEQKNWLWRMYKPSKPGTTNDQRIRL